MDRFASDYKQTYTSTDRLAASAEQKRVEDAKKAQELRIRQATGDFIGPSTLPSIPQQPQQGFVSRTIDNVKAFVRGDVSSMDVAREIPGTIQRGGAAIANFIAPSLTRLVKDSGSLIGEGLAYAIDPNVRKAYLAGNQDVLPTLTTTTPGKIVRETIGAGIEATVFKAIPNTITAPLIQRFGEGAMQGMGLAIADGISTDKKPEEIFNSMIEYGVPAAALSTVAPYLLPLLRHEFGKVPPQVKETLQNVSKKIQVESLTPESSQVPIDELHPKTSPNRIQIQNQDRMHNVPINTENANTFYPPSSELPTIDFGETPKAEPSIQVSGKSGELPLPPGMHLVPEPKPVVPEPSFPKKSLSIPEQKQTVPTQTDVPKTRVTAPETPHEFQAVGFTPDTKVTAKTIPVSRDVLPVGEGKTQVSKLEQRVRDSLKSVSPYKVEDLPTYKQMSKAENIRKATEYVTKNEEEALAVLRGDKEAPAGVLHNSIAIALEKKAEIEGNRSLAIRLASLRSTRAGQEISVLTEVDPTNPISMLHDIIKERVGRAMRLLKNESVPNATRRITTEVKTFADKRRIKLAEAEKILEQIVC